MDTPEQQQEEHKKYKENLKFEHELINRRLTWLFNSQTVLIAVAVFANKSDGTKKAYDALLCYLPILGALSCLLIFIGILAGVIAKRRVWKDYKDKINYEEEWGVRTWITKLALFPDITLPIIFLSLWLVIWLG